MGTLKNDVLPDLGQLTAAFCRYLDREIVEENGVFLLPDPYETEYSENYGCACAAVAYAGAIHRDESPELRRNYRRMLDRTLQLAADGTVAPFCRTFLAHFAAMSLLMLPEAERRAQGEDPVRFLLNFEDPCSMIVVNCAAMQLSTQIFLHALSGNPMPPEKAERFLSFIRAARCASGFINDSVGEERGVWDFMPIAYHGFITFLLSTGLVFGRRFGVLPPECDAAMAGLIHDNVKWLGNVFLPDGSFAMCGRSRYQAFTWGVQIALARLTGAPEERLQKIVARYLRFAKPDGSYSCTPNELPHSFRAGFEGYTHVNMYNTLCFAAMAFAAEVGAKDVFGQWYPADLPDGVTVDREAGYAFLRNRGGYCGVALRDHAGVYTPGMGGFHYTLPGVLLPLAESRMSGAVPVRDGIAFRRDGMMHYPEFPADVEASGTAAGGVTMSGTDERFGRISRKIAVDDRTVSWECSWDAAPEWRMAVPVQLLPVIVNDGRNQLRVRSLGAAALELSFAGSVFRLHCEGARKTGLSLARSLDSVSGLCAEIQIELPPPEEQQACRSWRTVLEVLS